MSSATRACPVRARVIQFYGVGGIGKTRLLRELEAGFRETYPDAAVVSVDFDDSSVHQPHRALLRIRQSGKTSKRLHFHTFDAAYALHFAHRNPDIELRRRELPFLEEAGVVGDLIGGLDGLGLVGAIKGVVEQIYRRIDGLAIPDEAKEALKAARSMSERQIDEVLPEFLAFDLNARKEPLEPLVLFVDTYEALWNNHTDDRERFVRDHWMRRLVGAMQNSLVVVAGREQLQWTNYAKEWSSVVETHLLDQLSRDDVERFLKSAGISEQSMIDQISATAMGHPYYLDLCLDMLAQEGEQTPQRWPESKPELFERFARSLTTQELSLLKRLAPLASYDDRYARAAARHFNIGLNDDQIRAHQRFSFVKPHGQAWTIHELMRRSLLENTSPETTREVRSFAVAHFTERLSCTGPWSADDEIVLPFQECARQLRCLQDPHAAKNWLALAGRSAISLLQQRAATGPVLATLDTFGEVVPTREWPSSVLTAYADVTHLIGRYQRSIEMLEEQIAAGGGDPTLNDELAFANVRRIHHSMMFLPIGPLWQEAEEFWARLSPVRHHRAFDELLFLLGGNLGATRGMVEEALPWLAEAIKRAWRSRDNVLKVRILRKVSDLHRISGDLRRSRRVLERGLALCERLSVPRYLSYLRTTMIDQLRLEGRTGEALAEFEPLRERLARDNLDGWLGHTYLLEAAVHLDLNATQAAQTALAKACGFYERTNHLWGRLQCQTISLRASAQSGVSVDDPGAVASHSIALRNAGYIRDAQLLAQFDTTLIGRIPAIPFL
ncbi:MAG: hypothetical protein AB7F38_03925 [Piscinibacter sp.]